jgi:peptidyl-prolyl cis-trans isomerase B (cyclophilin B)
VPSNEQRREAAKRKLERQLVRRAQRARRRRVTSISVTAVVVLLVAGGVYYLATKPSSSAADQSSTPTTTSAAPISIPTALAPAPKRPTPLPATVTCAYPKDGAGAKANNLPNGSNISSQGTVSETLKTNDGDIPLTLDRSLAPCAVNSFVSLSDQGYYDNTSCHRLSTQGLQMLQCGDPKGDGTGGPGYKFDDEVWSSIKYGRGYLAMANSGPNTNGSQFFLVYGDASGLSASYTVFGTISEAGLKVIDDIARAGDDGAFNSSAGGGHPNKKVTITKAQVAS